uniref:Uncharacterized protein n=1 Tax=Timema poppense TaxID=170557 RepID=A0A7R9DKG4_TIMPO|nr:unnamed protein product [Timema poppensis]
MSSSLVATSCSSAMLIPPGAMTRSDTRCPQPRSRCGRLRKDPRFLGQGRRVYMSSSLFPGGLFNLFEIGTSRQPWWKGVYMEVIIASVSYERDVTVCIQTECTWKQVLLICPGHECRTIVLTVVAIPLLQGSSGTASSLSSEQRLQFVVTTDNINCGENCS